MWRCPQAAALEVLAPPVVVPPGGRATKAPGMQSLQLGPQRDRFYWINQCSDAVVVLWARCVCLQASVADLKRQLVRPTGLPVERQRVIYG